MKSSLLDIPCFLRMETSRAWLINDGTREVWIPKSQGELAYEDNDARRGLMCYTLTLAEWLAREKELI